MVASVRDVLPWLAAALLLRWVVSLHGYSGENAIMKKQ